MIVAHYDCPQDLDWQCAHGHIEYKRSVTEDGNVKFSCVCKPDISYEELKPVECAHYSCPNGKLGDCKRMGKCTVCKCFPSHCHNVPFTCPQNCKLQMEGDCPKCHCPFKRSLCPPTCQIFCQYGYVKDERGCNTCKCKPEQDSSKCQIRRSFSPSKCLMLCPYGYEQDERGCRTCRCKPKNDLILNSKCPKVRCPLNCEGAYEVIENNCPICKCKSSQNDIALKSTCPKIMCDLHCIEGLAVDENGCEICKCKSSDWVCPQFTCYIDCIYGYVKDSNNCNICQCIPRPILLDGGDASGTRKE